MSKSTEPKLRLLPSVLLFVSAYSPLSIIFLIQDYDFNKHQLCHPILVWSAISVSIASCILLWLSVANHKDSSPIATVKSVSNRSGELINYSIPYMISFFVMDLGDIKMLLSFGFFMFLMFWLTIKTHNIFINPVLAMLGYNLYDVRYERKGNEFQHFFLVKGTRLKAGQECRIKEIYEQLYIVTDPNPEL